MNGYFQGFRRHSVRFPRVGLQARIKGCGLESGSITSFWTNFEAHELVAEHKLTVGRVPIDGQKHTFSEILTGARDLDPTVAKHDFCPWIVGMHEL